MERHGGEGLLASLPSPPASAMIRCTFDAEPQRSGRRIEVGERESMASWKLRELGSISALTAVFWLLASAPPVCSGGVSTVDLTVIVTDAVTNQPINQAKLTLQFREPGDVRHFKRPKWVSYSAKTNPQGRYRFTDIPVGTVHLIVTDPDHQTFGKDFSIDQAHPEITVKLKKPHPLL